MDRRRFLKIGGIGLSGLTVASCGSNGNEDPAPSPNPSPSPSPSPGPDPIEIERGIQFAPETLCLTPGSTTEELNLNWYSDITGENLAIARFIDDMNEIITANGVTSNASTDKRAHKVTVTGLQPDKWYRYSVSNDGINWSYEYSYRTPLAEGFRFVVIGDPQLTAYHTSGNGLQDRTSNGFSYDETTAQGWKDTIAKVGALDVDFIAGVGDQVDKTGDGDEQEYRHFMAPPELRSIPWAPSVGNHDRHYPFRYHYNLPNELEFDSLLGAAYGNGTNQQYADIEAAGHYYYLYNNALFVVLNTSAYPNSKENAAPFIERFNQTLTAAKEANAGKYDWIFVQHHKSTASVADHIADRDIQYYVEAGFEELMSTHGVDFVLAGHDHVYARSYPMIGKKDGVPSEPDTTKGGAQIANPDGVIYVTATTGSGLKYYDLYNQSGNLYVKNNEEYPYLVDGETGSEAYAGANLTAGCSAAVPCSAVGLPPLSNAARQQAKIPQYTVVDVEGNTVKFETFNTYGNTTTSIDSFTVTK